MAPSVSVSLSFALASIIIFAVGYQLGTVLSRPARISPPPPASTTLSPTPPAPVPQPSTMQNTGAEPDSEEEAEAAADGNLAAVRANFLEPCKMVLVVRTDLNMSPGKIAAQCGHAAVACYKTLSRQNPGLVRHWEQNGQAKIALKVKSEDELLELEAIARSLNLCARSIQDAGRTEVASGSRTVLGIGPAPVKLVNEVTGHLRLL